MKMKMKIIYKIIYIINIETNQLMYIFYFSFIYQLNTLNYAIHINKTLNK